MNKFIDALYSRKSVRSYTGEPVSDEELKTILKAATGTVLVASVTARRTIFLTEKTCQKNRPSDSSLTAL